MKQTAVEWLVEQLDLDLDLKWAVNQGKAMEKEQIQSAYIKGYTQSSWGRHSNSEQYYNETFKQQEDELQYTINYRHKKLIS